MADQKLSDLTAIPSVALTDLLYVVDVSDTTDAAAGSSRKATVAQVKTGINTISGGNPNGVTFDWILMNTLPAGTPVNGFGLGIAFYADDSTTAETFLGQFSYSWSTVAHASKVGQFVLTVAYAAGSAAAITIQNSGGNITTTLAGAVTVGTSLTLPNIGLRLQDTDASHVLIVVPGSNLTANRTLTITTGDFDRVLQLVGDATISGTHTGSSSGTNTGDQTITLTGDVTGGGTGSFAATIKAINGFTAADPALADLLLGYDSSATANRQFQADRLLGLIRMAPGGRLTLVSGSPVYTSAASGIGTVYYTPYLHDMICLWDGTRWVWGTFSEISITLSGLTAGRPYDVFGYLSSGALALEILAWTSATVRATAVTIQDGRYCKSGDKTRLYLGTFYTTGTATTADTSAQRFLWNMYNRVSRPLYVSGGASHGYGTGTWRQYNNVTTTRFEFVVGIAGDPLPLGVQAQGNAGMIVGAGLDATNTSSLNGFVFNSGTSSIAAGMADNLIPAAGYHFLTLTEFGNAPGATFEAANLTATLQA